MSERDMLKEMFRMQTELNKRIGVGTPDTMTEEEQQRWVLNYLSLIHISEPTRPY